MTCAYGSPIDVNGRGPGPGRLIKAPSYGNGPPVWFAIWTDAQGGRHRRQLSTDKRVAEQAFNKLMRERDLEINSERPWSASSAPSDLRPSGGAGPSSEP